MANKIINEERAAYYAKKGIDTYAIGANTYNDKTANGLQKCILDYCKYRGHFASRVSVTGRWVKDSNHIYGGKYIKAAIDRGFSDLLLVVNGKPIFVEVKIGSDRQSEDQKKFEKRVTDSKGVYFIVKNFNEFLEKIKQYESE